MNTKNSQESPLSSSYPEGTPTMEFGGWEMPRDFGGIVQEHKAVRDGAGIFDLSHMGRLILRGPQIAGKLQTLFTRRLDKTAPGIARYGFLCRNDGGCIDDVIIYLRSDKECWLVVNAGNRKAVVEWLSEKLTGVELEDRTLDTALLAIQGPTAPEWFDSLSLASVPSKPFRVTWEEETMVASTGYTGEAGGECWCPVDRGRDIFTRALDEGLVPCGLGARDTLRLEKGYPLHGHDLSETIDPLTAGLGFFIDWDHDFVGKEALQQIRENGPDQQITGVRTESRRSPREGQRVRLVDGESIGKITSGRYSPTLGQGIGLALLESGVHEEQPVEIEMRDNWISATVEKPPFV